MRLQLKINGENLKMEIVKKLQYYEFGVVKIAKGARA